MSNDAVVESATLDGLDLVIYTAEAGTADVARPFRVNVRDIANSEIQHDIDSQPEVRVYVVVFDSQRGPLFAARVVERKFVGSIKDVDTLNSVRELFRLIGAPIIEYWCCLDRA